MITRAAALLVLALALPGPPGGAAAAERGAPLETIRDVFAALRACWRPPARPEGPTGMEVTVRLSFRRDGSVLGQPRITYYKTGGTPEQQQAFRTSVTAALAACTPLALSESLGSAIAGRPLTLRFSDNRAT